jgi:hypothetical protein
MNHGIILGLKTMKQIDLDTSVCNSSISWSNKLVTPMVLPTFWTKERLQKMVESLNTSHADLVQESPSQESLVIELTAAQQSDHHPTFSELGNLKVNQLDIKEGFLKIPLNQDAFVTKFLPKDYNKPNLKNVVNKITRLTKKDFKFAWEEDQETAFKLIKEKVAETIMLTYLDPAKTFKAYLDVSRKFTMGAVLVQDGKVI